MIDLARTNAILTSRASAQAVKIAEGLRFSTLDDVLAQMRGSTLPGDMQQHFIDLLTERSKGLINSAADATANEALALGRHDEMTVFAQDIEVATYTSLLDENTCDPCSEADGTETPFGSAEYERLRPPYRECDSAAAPGGNRCRCQMVLTLKTEAPSGPIPITPLHPIAPFLPAQDIGIMPPLLPSNPIVEAAREIAVQAKAAEPAITSAVTGIAKQTGGTMGDLNQRLKTEGSLTRKIATDPKLVALGPQDARSGISDAVRYTVLYDPKEYAAGAARTRVALKAAGFDEVKFENYWADATNPYQGINSLWRTADGQKFEVQFHTRESLDVKLVRSHPLYEKYRIATDPAVRAALDKEIAAVWQGVTVPQGVIGHPGLVASTPVVPFPEAKALAQAIRDDGGFTYEPRTKNQPKVGLSVSPYKDREMIVQDGPDLAEHVTAYADKNRDLLALPGHHIGAWRDTDGKVYLDVSIVSKTEQEAFAIAKANGQLAYYNLGTGETVKLADLPATGPAAASPTTPSGGSGAGPEGGGGVRGGDQGGRASDGRGEAEVAAGLKAAYSPIAPIEMPEGKALVTRDGSLINTGSVPHSTALDLAPGAIARDVLDKTGIVSIERDAEGLIIDIRAVPTQEQLASIREVYAEVGKHLGKQLGERLQPKFDARIRIDNPNPPPEQVIAEAHSYEELVRMLALGVPPVTAP